MHQQVFRDKAITLLTAEGTTIKQLTSMADNMLDMLQYQAKTSGWTGTIVLCGSDTDSKYACNLVGKKYTGGRPIKYFYEPKRLKTKVSPHIHMMILDACPNTAITDKLNDYWTKRQGEKTAHFQNVDIKKGGRAGYMGYMERQASFWREAELG